MHQPYRAFAAEAPDRWLASFALVLATALLAWGAFEHLAVAIRAIRYPFGIDYGEGIVWEQMRLIVAGKGYGPIDGLPAIVFHYPPLYHVSVAALAAVTGLDPLAAGRLLTVSATIATGVLAAAIVAASTRPASGRAAWLCGIIAGLAIFMLSPVVFWSSLMRVDMLALAFGYAGLYFGIRALTRPRAVVFAALFFVAAVYTKQTSIAPPVAAFATLLFLRPRTAVTGIAICVAIGLLVLIGLQAASGGGFVRHVFLFNMNRLDWTLLYAIVGLAGTYVVYLAVAAFAVVDIVRAPTIRALTVRHRGGTGSAALRAKLLAAPADAAVFMVLMYVLVTTAMLVLVAKSGASTNYFIEWMCAIALLAGIACRDAAGIAFRTSDARKPIGVACLVPFGLAYQAFVTPNALPLDRLAPPADAIALTRLTAMVRASPRPVVSDDMVVLLRAGQPVWWEPAIFAELASTGMWNEKPFVARIEDRAFGFFVTTGGRGDRPFDDRYNPAVADAINAAYPVKRRLAGYTLHLPEREQNGFIRRRGSAIPPAI